jgi:hypothetical protein
MVENSNININTSNLYILEKKYSLILLTSSLMFGINSIYGFYNYLYNDMIFLDVLLSNTFLFITSVNYWRKPIEGFRKNIDLVACLINLFYNTYSVYNCQYSWIGFIVIKCVMGFYMISWFYYNKNRVKLSIFWHIMSQLSGCIGNFIVFTGLISIPIIYEIEDNITNESSYKLLFGVSVFILYTISYLTVIMNPELAKMITPDTYKNKNTVHELVAYSMSTINALILCIVGLFHCINPVDDNLNMIDYVFYFSIAYYMSDIIYLFITSKDYVSNISFVVHHLMSITMMVYQVQFTEYRNHVGYIGMRLCLAEFSVIPLNYIWYLKNTDNNYKVNYNYVIAFESCFRLFFLCRILNYTHLLHLLYKLVESEIIHYLMSGCVIVLTLLNYVWFYKIYQIKNVVKKFYKNNNVNNKNDINEKKFL